MHWITLGIMAPLGKTSLIAALITISFYLYFLSLFFQRDR